MPELHCERVLLVERPNGRDMLKRALEHVGFDVDVADTGEQALLIVAARRPAVVISDIDLPIMNGWQLAEALRARFGRRIRLVALTSRDERADRQRSEAAGFDVHLVKPAAPELVHSTIRDLLIA
jgi:CheY-like chemotaxis protein